MTEIHVGESVVARISARAAGGVEGVAHLQQSLVRSFAAAVTGRMGGRDPDGDTPGGVRVEVTAPRRATVEVALAVRFGPSCVAVATAVQETVAEHLLALAGVDAAVGIDITDVEWSGPDGDDDPAASDTGADRAGGSGGSTGAGTPAERPDDAGGPAGTRTAAGGADGVTGAAPSGPAASGAAGPDAPGAAPSTPFPSSASPDQAPTRAEVGRRLAAGLEETGSVEVWAGAGDLPDLPGLPPRGISVSDDRVVAHLRLLRLPVADVTDGLTAAADTALTGTPWAGATLELHLDELDPESLPAG